MIKNLFKKLANIFYAATGIPTNAEQRIDKDCKIIRTNITSCLPDFKNGGVDVTVNLKTHDLNISINKNNAIPSDIKTIEATTFSLNTRDLNNRYKKIVITHGSKTTLTPSQMTTSINGAPALGPTAPQ